MSRLIFLRHRFSSHIHPSLHTPSSQPTMSDHSKFIVVFKKDATDEQINEYKERVKRESA